MAQRRTTATEVAEATRVAAEIKDGAEAQIADTLVAFEISMAEVTMAKRLYEVWRTAGQLGDSKWDWSRQSTMAQHAWIAVARAASPPVLQKRWDTATIAGLNHG